MPEPAQLRQLPARARPAARPGAAAPRPPGAGCVARQRAAIGAQRARARPTSSCSSTSATTRSLAVAVVHSTATPSGSASSMSLHAAVVGAEVVAPVRDAVRLVDDQQAHPRGEQRQHLARGSCGLFSRSGLISSRSTASAASRRAHVLPLRRGWCELIVCARSPSRSAAAIWLRISASSGRDDQRRPRAARRAAGAWRRSRRRYLPQPVRCTQRTRGAVVDEVGDRLALVVAEVGVRIAREGDQRVMGLVAHAPLRLRAPGSRPPRHRPGPARRPVRRAGPPRADDLRRRRRSPRG